MKLNIYIAIFLLMLSVTTTKVLAQGCVAVRQMGGTNPLTSSGYTLGKHELQVGASYRYFHSFRHFVGTDEKPFRQHTQGGFENGVEKGNAVNIYSHAVDLNISYGITDRLQVNLTIPYVNNERSQVLALQTGGKVMIDGQEKDQVTVGNRYSLYAQGLGDIRISTNYWVFDPKASTKGNIMIGAGVKFKNGSHSTKDNVPQKDGTNISSTNDQAIQPGDGGVGFSLELQGFRKIYEGIYGFANGYYLFNPNQSNGSYKGSSADLVVKDPNDNTKTLATLKGYNSFASPDQYFMRMGFMSSVLKNKALTLSLAARWEGIPAFDAFGGQHAFRRPGYVVAVEPGVSYRLGKHSMSLFVPYNFIKNRIQSSNDIATQNLQNAVITDSSKKVHVQGDAAFADYSISLNYSYRFGKLF